MDDQQPELARELMGVTYARLVERMARQAFNTDRTAEFLNLVDGICAECGIELLSHDLVERMVSGFDNPFDQFLVRVEIRSSALWEFGDWTELLRTLRRKFGSASTTPAGDAAHSHRPALRRRSRADLHTPASRRADPPAR